MPDDRTLPGDLPGLLRRGSPVLAPVSARVRTIGRRALVEGEHLDSGLVLLADGGCEPAPAIALDLTDPTGRVHAAWWAWDAWRAGRRESLILPVAPPTITEAEEEILRTASYGRDMSNADIITLRDLCLRLGGRTP